PGGEPEAAQGDATEHEVDAGDLARLAREEAVVDDDAARAEAGGEASGGGAADGVDGVGQEAVADELFDALGEVRAVDEDGLGAPLAEGVLEARPADDGDAAGPSLAREGEEGATDARIGGVHEDPGARLQGGVVDHGPRGQRVDGEHGELLARDI